ncbi:MAG: TULIP family P47-like protein [Pseudomonadota bacterium]
MTVTMEEQPVLTERPADWDGKYYYMKLPEFVQTPERKIDPAKMMLGGPAPLNQMVDTYNWDTCFAIRFADANRGLMKPGASPTTFQLDDSGVILDGTFNPWQLSGGAGILLNMQVPIATGTMTYDGSDYDMAGALATLQIQLRMLEDVAHEADRDPHEGVPHLLVANGDVAVSVTQLTNVPDDPGFAIIAIMQGALQLWFNENLAEFTHSFATINVNEVADQEQFQWLKPTGVGYAVSAQGAPEDHVMGILSMTEDRSKPVTQQISPNAVPDGAVAGFLIAQKRFLEKLVLPAVHCLFEKASPDDFELVNNGTMIRNVNEVYWDTAKIDGSSYTPRLGPGQFMLTLEANEVRMELKKATIDWAPGIKIKMDYTAFSSIKLDVNSKGEQILNYEEASPPIIDHNVELESWVIWAQVAAGVAVAVATFGAGAWAKKAIETVAIRVAVVIITLIVGSLLVAIPQMMEAVANDEKDDIPPVDLTMLNATCPIKWAGAQEFELTSAMLNTSLQMGGDPHFID